MEQQEQTVSSQGGPLSSARVDGVFIYVEDFQKMLGFYRDTLGFNVTYANDGFASMRTESGAEVDLHAGRNPDLGKSYHWFLHMTVDDIERTVKELGDLGVAVSEISEADYGKTASFKDPEDNAIGLEQLPG